MTRLFLVRHGETQWNREELFRGRSDIPLSEEGRKQAEALADSLTGQDIAAFYASPLSRAKQTAEAVARRAGNEVVVLPELVDMAYGEWEGRPLEEVKREDPQFAVWEKTPERFRPPGGETLDEVINRSFPAWEKLLAKHPDEAILLVTHRVLTKLLLCRLLGLGSNSFWAIKQDTCCLNVVEAEKGRYVLARVNDTCHLRGQRPDRIDF